MTEAIAVPDAQALVRYRSFAGCIRESVSVATQEVSTIGRETHAVLPNHPPRSLLPGVLPTASARWNRHQLAADVSVPADFRGGDEVAEETPSDLSDQLSVRTIAVQLEPPRAACRAFPAEIPGMTVPWPTLLAAAKS